MALKVSNTTVVDQNINISGSSLNINPTPATGSVLGTITTNRYLFKRANGGSSGTGPYSTHSDVNGSGGITSGDVLPLLRVIGGTATPDSSYSVYNDHITLAFQHSDTRRKVGIGFIEHTSLEALEVGTSQLPTYDSEGVRGMLVGYPGIDTDAPKDIYFAREYVAGPLTETGLVKSIGKRYFFNAVFERHRALTAVSGTVTIDVSSGNCFSTTIAGATTFAISGMPVAVTTGLVSFILDLTNGGSSTITWWSNMKWVGGTAPTLTASGRDVLGFFTRDNGTTWTGLVMGKDVK